MTVPYTAALHPPADLVVQQWIRTISGFTADGVGGELPEDEYAWAQGGYVLVPVTVGGTPGTYAPIRKPVAQIECWATVPGSDKLPWSIATQLAEQIRMATYDRVTCSRLLYITNGSVSYPPARVLSSTCMTEPRRIYSDAGDYAGQTFDLELQFVACEGEQIA
jgi:hypothetical protein